MIFNLANNFICCNMKLHKIMLVVYTLFVMCACRGPQHPNNDPVFCEDSLSNYSEEALSLHLYYHHSDEEFGYNEFYDFHLQNGELFFIKCDTLMDRIMLQKSDMDSIETIISELGEPYFDTSWCTIKHEYYLIVNDELVFYSYNPDINSQYKVTRSLEDYLFNLFEHDN